MARTWQLARRAPPSPPPSPPLSDPPAHDEPLPAEAMPTMDEVMELRTYKSFKLQSAATKFEVKSFIYVRGDPSSEPKTKKRKSIGGVAEPVDPRSDDWVAQILDIRANDTKAVFLVVAWLFTSPAQFNEYATVRGLKQFKRNEVVMSDVHDIINVNMVQDSASVIFLEDALPIQPYISPDSLWYRNCFRAVKAEEHDELEKTLTKDEKKLFSKHIRAGNKDHMRSCFLLNKPTCECGKAYHPQLTGTLTGNKPASEMVFCPRSSCRRWRHVACVSGQPPSIRAGWTTPSLPAADPSPDASEAAFLSSGVDLLSSMHPSSSGPASHPHTPCSILPALLTKLDKPAALARLTAPLRPGPGHTFAQLFSALPPELVEAAHMSIRRGTARTGVSGPGEPVIRARGVLVVWAEVYRDEEEMPAWEAQGTLRPLDPASGAGGATVANGNGNGAAASGEEQPVRFGPRTRQDAMVDAWMEAFGSEFAEAHGLGEGGEGEGPGEEDEKRERLVCRSCRFFI